MTGRGPRRRFKVVIGGGEISVEVHRRKVRNAYMTLSTDYHLKVILPARGRVDVDGLLERKRAWLEKKIQELSERRRVLTEDRMYYYGKPLAIQTHRAEEVSVDVDERNVDVFAPEGVDIRQILAGFLRDRTADHIPQLVTKLADRLGLRYGKVSFGTKRFGYCTTKADLRFNDKLVCLPSDLQELVVLHELVHIKHFNHSKEFKAEMAKHLPSFAELDKELKRWDLS